MIKPIDIIDAIDELYPLKTLDEQKALYKEFMNAKYIIKTRGMYGEEYRVTLKGLWFYFLYKKKLWNHSHLVTTNI